MIHECKEIPKGMTSPLPQLPCRLEFRTHNGTPAMVFENTGEKPKWGSKENRIMIQINFCPYCGANLRKEDETTQTT